MASDDGGRELIRVATCNILHGRSPADGRVDLDRFQEGIASLDADLLALQEVDRHQPRSGGADLAALAAEAMGAVDHRFVATLHGRADDGWLPASGATAPAGPAYGIALLTRLPATAWSTLLLPTLRRRVPVRRRGDLLPGLLREEPRVAVAAHIAAPAGPMVVVNTHLSFVPWWNPRQLEALTRSLSGHHGTALLLGDLNMGPGRARWITGLVTLARTETFPADRPRVQLDHVLATEGAWSVASTRARPLPFSDHRALVVDLG